MVNAKFPEVLNALEQARHHIHMEYYIFCYDDVGKKIVDVLIRKVKEGVEVRIIIDDFGSTKNRKMVRRLRKAGVTVHRFMPVAFPFLAQANFRNHRKIIVVDGRIGFEGGINIDERYLNNGKHKLYLERYAHQNRRSARQPITNAVSLKLAFYI